MLQVAGLIKEKKMLVRDLIALLANVDGDLNVRMTMNMDYDDSVGSVYISGDALYFDDIPSDTVGDTVLYSAHPV
jgi:hypothetical protein